MKFFRRLFPCLLVILALVLIFPIICNCSGPDESDRFLQLLKLVPSELKDSLEIMPITLIDLASYYEDYNIPLTDSEGNTVTLEEYVEYIRENEIRLVLGGSSFITGWGQYAESMLIQDKYLGYDFTNLDAEILTGTPPNDVGAAIGRYDPQITRDALSNQDEWPSWAVEAYATEEYRGVTIHSWGSGLEIHLTDRFVPPHIDMLGRAMPLAVTDEFLFYAATMEIIKLMIDASQGKVESLADLQEFASIADGLSELHTYEALIAYEWLANGDPEYTETYPGPRLKKFVTFGSGIGEDERGIFTALVLYHESSDNAKANASLLEQRIAGTDSIINGTPWSEIITGTDIRVEGQLLMAKLYADSITLWAMLGYSFDILLLHEQ
jgi:hypothetical protein